MQNTQTQNNFLKNLCNNNNNKNNVIQKGTKYIDNAPKKENQKADIITIPTKKESLKAVENKNITNINLEDAKNKNTEENTNSNTITKDFDKIDLNAINNTNQNHLALENNTMKVKDVNSEPTHYKKPKKINTESYVKTSTNLYSNIYPIDITKTYNIYYYNLKFLEASEDINTYLKSKIIKKSYSQLQPLYGTYFFSGDAFYATKKIDEVKTIELDLYGTKHWYMIKYLNNSFELKSDHKKFVTPENMFIIKNIFELMFKNILSGNPDLKMEKNLFVRDMTTKIVNNRYDEQQLVLKPGYSTKVLILENGIFLNVDNKNKIINCKDCYTLMKEKNKGARPNTKEQFKYWENYLNGRLVETKHNQRKMKVDGISFDKNPKNTNINYDGKNKIFFLL